MSDDAVLLDAAIAGDHAALGVLLMRHHDRLRRRVTQWIEPRLRPVLDVEDILQDAYAEAYQHIRQFQPNGEISFHAWLVTIAQHRYFNVRRGLLAEKRGAARRVDRAKADASSLLELVGVLAGGESTPSRKAGRGEAGQLLCIALAGLKEEYRQALRMRYVEGRPVKEIAAALGRTERAVHMLCHRGLRVLRERMGSASKYMTSW